MDNPFGVAGKSALVVGAGQGIGRAVSLALSRAGANVVALDADAARAEVVATEIIEGGGQALALACDVLDDGQARAAVAKGAQAWGGLDILVTVVGSTGYTPLLEMTGDQWDFEQRLNLRYAFIVGQAFAAQCIDAGRSGAITLISSVSGIVSAPRHAPYGAAKAGVIHLVKSMAVEWAPYGIRVNSVAPGPIITPRLPDTEEWREKIRQSAHPMQRRGEVEEIANPVLFLCSDLASYVTGQTLAVDGGLTAANILAIPERQGRNDGSDSRAPA